MTHHWNTVATITGIIDRSWSALARTFRGQSGRDLAAGTRTSHRQRGPRRVHVSELMLPPASVWTGVLLCFGAAVFPQKTEGQSIVPSGVEKSISGSRTGDQGAPAVSVAVSY